MADQKFDVLDGLDISGDVIIDTNVLYVDTVANRVGINKAPASGSLDISGTTVSQNLTLSNLAAQASESTSLMINGSGVVGTRELGTRAFDSATYDNYVSFTVSGDGGPNQAITSGNTLKIAGGAILTTTASATDTITIAHDNVTVTQSTAAQSNPSYGTVVNVVTGVSSTTQGHIGTVTTTPVRIPLSDNTDTKVTTAAAGSATYYPMMVTTGAANQGGLTKTAAFSFNATTDLLNVTGAVQTANVIANVLELANEVHHSGDTTTKMAFTTGTMTFQSSGATKLTIGSTISLAANTDCTGASLSGNIVKSNDYFLEKRQVTTGASPTLNLLSGSSFDHTPGASYVAAFTNVPVGDTTSWTFKVNNGGVARTATWNATLVGGSVVGIKWAEGVIPPPSTGVDIYSFIAIGGIVYGSLSMRAAA